VPCLDERSSEYAFEEALAHDHLAAIGQKAAGLLRSVLMKEKM